MRVPCLVLCGLLACCTMTACGPQPIYPENVNVERSSSPTIPVVVYEVPTSSVKSHVTEFRDQHGRACTAIYYNGSPVIDCDFPPAPAAECPPCSR